MKSGTVTVLVGEEQLKKMNESEVKNQISLLKCPKFWRVAGDTTNSWTNSFKGRVKWGYLYNNECAICISKNECKGFCKHRTPCKLYSLVNEKGDEVIKIKRVSVNAKLPGKAPRGQQGMT